MLWVVPQGLCVRECLERLSCQIPYLSAYMSCLRHLHPSVIPGDLYYVLGDLKESV